jgi:hypothetical protein
MAGAFWRRSRDLIHELKESAPRFGFFQAVRLLALTARHQGEKVLPLLPRRLRFRTAASLSFPASELTQYRPLGVEAFAAGQRHDELEVAFMGLTGPSAVLPRPYTEKSSTAACIAATRGCMPSWTSSTTAPSRSSTAHGANTATGWPSKPGKPMDSPATCSTSPVSACATCGGG